MEVIIYFGFWTFEMKCTQYGICGEVAFKNARTMGFFESRAGRAKVFGRVQKIPVSLWGSCPCPNIPPLKGS